MKLGNLTIGHDFRDFYRHNPLLDSRLIFLELDSNSEKHIRSLKLELEILEQDLKNPNNLGRFSEIREKIAKNEAEIASLESVKDVKAPLNTLLLNGLQNNIDEIDRWLEKEMDIKKRETLKAKRLKCVSALAARQAPVRNPKDFSEAMEQIESDQRLLDALSKGKLDEVDLHLLLNSGLMPFIDYRFEGAIQIAFNQMLTNDNVHSALGGRLESISQEADRKWFEYEAKVEAGIKATEEEKKRIETALIKADLSEKETLRRRLKEIEDEIRFSRAQLQDGRLDWTHRQRTLLEEEAASKSVLDSVKTETLESLEKLLTEAQSIRKEAAQEYLSGEFAKLEARLSEFKEKKVFGKKNMQALENELNEAREIIVNQKGHDSKTLRKLAENIQVAIKTLSQSAKEVTIGTEKRPQMESQISADYARLKNFASLTPDQAEGLKEEQIALRAKEGFAADSAIVKKDLAGIDMLTEEGFTSIMADAEKDIGNLSALSDEELEELHSKLRPLGSIPFLQKGMSPALEEIRRPENHDARLAHETIVELQKTRTAQEVKTLLEEKLGHEHLLYVPHAEFEDKYRKYTEEGHMVFREQGEKWQVIIDESIFSLNEKEAVEQLKEQITHELLHLEFEKNESLKAEIRKNYVEANPKKWQEIREAFEVFARETDKQPPVGDRWEDDDILSELFAMNLGANLTDGNTAKDKLNNLLAGLGVATMGSLAEKERQYREDENKTQEERIRGFESGAESGFKNESVRNLSITEATSKEKVVYESNQEKIKSIRARIVELRKTEHLGMVPGGAELLDAMEKYTGGTAELNESLKSNPNSEILATAINARVDKVSGDLTEVEDKVGKAARNAPNNEIGLFRKLWINTSFLSLQSIVQVGVDAYEFMQRRHKRRVADQAAKLGMALFSGSNLGREARARQQKAEMEEVNEWKSRYENMDAWQLEKEIEGISNSLNPNQDQLKAILRILADKGHINWRNEHLWKALNKLQSKTELQPGDPLLLHNPILLRQRLRTALGEIYDYDEFDNLERTNESSYQSHKGKYDAVHDRMQDKLNDRLDELLSQHRAGEQVDPILYESILAYSITKGKCYAENVMFHLICGMAEGLLSPDRGLALGSTENYLNTWPAIDWFTTLQPPMSQADFKKMALQYFPEDYKRGSISASGFGTEFKNFYWTTIQNNNRVVERVKKSVSERSWDHDWGRSIACLGDADTAKRFLSGRSGQQETKVTAVSNAYVGAVQWLEENSINPQFAKKENFARMAGWITMSEGILDGSAYREASKDINTRANEAMNQDVPRESVFGRHGGANLRQHRDIVKQFLLVIDPEFFSMITGREVRSKEAKAELGVAARNHLIQRYPDLATQIADIDDIDQIFDRIDLIIGTMFTQMSEARFQSILASIARTVPR